MTIRYILLYTSVALVGTALLLDLDVAKSQRDEQQVNLFWLGGQRQQQSEDVINALGMSISCGK